MQDLSNDVGSLVKSASWIMKSPSKKTSTILFRSFCLMIIVMCIECKATCGLLRCALPGSLWRILRKGSLRRTCSPSFRWHHHQFFWWYWMMKKHFPLLIVLKLFSHRIKRNQTKIDGLSIYGRCSSRSPSFFAFPLALSFSSSSTILNILELSWRSLCPSFKSALLPERPPTYPY